MVQLQDLPIELLSHCLSFIKSRNLTRILSVKSLNRDGMLSITPQIRYNLMNVSLVSRKFRDLAQPLLFRDFEENGDLDRLIRFLRAVIVRPQLGKYVHVVTMNPKGRGSTEAFGEDLPKQDSDLFTDTAQELGLGDEEEAWLRGINEVDASSLLALLLTKTPNLRLLYFPGNTFSVGLLDTLVARDPSFLSNLEELHVTSDKERPNYCIAALDNTLTLSRLKIVVSQLGVLMTNDILSSWAPNTLPLERLYLLQSHVEYNSLKKLIQACKKLTHFTFVDCTTNRDYLRDWWREFDEADLHEALLPHQEYLEELGIDYFDKPFLRGPIESSAEFSEGRLPSLRDFTVLKYLIIPFSVLSSHPEFPPSLKRLKITHCDTSIWNITYCIATDCKKGRYPDLEQVKLESSDINHRIELEGQKIPEGQTPEQYFWNLRNLFKDTNVDYQILSPLDPRIHVDDDSEEEDDFPGDDSPEHDFPEDEFSEYGFSDEYETEGSIDPDDGIDQFI
ncbi:hypothetical protein BDV30DRAFT_232743 [Aspergillus minisclerotigenes]|uniref:F-box domain-containing protein n=1 Tax=Aspergillus minisclerotigenes TaxID=656917 RepID=A0A5N6JL36_9EURO|nr:hypothetical protein BDV30DRAFT_232743 [Aspergillus minisclerotigenes]